MSNEDRQPVLPNRLTVGRLILNQEMLVRFQLWQPN